ncbi:hypothetical protein IAT38_004124 [Cryptococcus sp. DSM 104549]
MAQLPQNQMAVGADALYPPAPALATLRDSPSTRHFMTYYRLPDATDDSHEATLTRIPDSAVRKWRSEEVRFFYDEEAAARLGDRLSNIQLDSPVPPQLNDPEPDDDALEDEMGVKRYLEQMRGTVETIVNRRGTPPVENAKWLEVTDGRAGRADLQVATKRNGVRSYRGHFVEMKRPYHLQKYLKPFLRALKDGIAVTLRRRGGVTSVEFSQNIQDFASDADQTALTRLLTQPSPAKEAAGFSYEPPLCATPRADIAHTIAGAIGGAATEKRRAGKTESDQVQLDNLCLISNIPNKSASRTTSRVFCLPISLGTLEGPWTLEADKSLPSLVPTAETLNPLTLAQARRCPPFILGDQRGQGRLWDVYNAIAAPGPLQVVPPDHPLAPFIQTRALAKLASPPLFPFGQLDSSYTEAQARDAIVHELEVMGKLSSLQGSAIPMHGGLWGGLVLAGEDVGRQVFREIWMAVVEDCGEAVDLETLSELDKSTIVSHYRAIHNAGILHNDVVHRHWLRHPSGGIRIIDFDSALVIQDLRRGDSVYAGTSRCWDALVAGSEMDLDGCSGAGELTENYRAAVIEAEMRAVKRMLKMA